MKSRIFILLFTALSVFALFNTSYYKHNLNWDKSGYYIYLPAIFIHHDLAYLDFYPKIDSAFVPTQDVKWYSIYQDSVTHKRFTKYPVGVALFELPFFLGANVYADITHQDKLYGYALCYEISVCLASIFWVMVGLFFLRGFLLSYFDDTVTIVSMLLVCLATNLYRYAVFEGGMSHPYSFTLFAALLYFLDRWLKNGKISFAILTGIALGWITITRPTNAIIVLFIPLWNVGTLADLKQRFVFFFEKKLQTICLALAFFAVLLIQLSYWMYITNHWIIYSYTNEYFDFLHPYIMDGLFSYRKGWFVYTPLAYFFVAGLFFIYKYYSRALLSVTLFFIINIYIIFSWSCWWYGGGFGARALIESYAILSFPLACLVKYMLRPGKSFQTRLIITTIVALSLVELNVLQSYQFMQGIISYDETTSERYWGVFGKFKW